MVAMVKTPKLSTLWPRLRSTVWLLWGPLWNWGQVGLQGLALYQCPLLFWFPADPAVSDSSSTFSLLPLPGSLCPFPFALPLPWCQLSLPRKGFFHAAEVAGLG